VHRKGRHGQRRRLLLQMQTQTQMQMQMQMHQAWRLGSSRGAHARPGRD
jgi:hypothetical protein